MFVGYVRGSCPDIFCDAETDETEKSLIEFRGARRYVFYSRADAAQLLNDTSPSSTLKKQTFTLINFIGLFLFQLN